MTEVRCMFCGKKHLEGLEGKAVWTCPRCNTRNCIERELVVAKGSPIDTCDILSIGKVGATYRETGEQRNDTRLGSAVKLRQGVKS